MKADRASIQANGQDLSYIEVELLDQDGNRSVQAANLVNFDLEGPGEIVAVASSDPMSTESYQAPYRRSYQGRCLVVVKSTEQPGEIRLSASSEGLQAETINIQTQ